MELRQRNKTYSKRTSFNRRGKREDKIPTEYAIGNEDILAKKRDTSKKAYWKDKENSIYKAANELLITGQLKEVYRFEDTDPEYVFLVVYTMQEAADALGKSILTLKKWIKEEHIPAPILKCSSYGYLHYEEGEMQIISKFLQEFQNGRVYLSKNDASNMESLWQRIDGYRRSHI